jgi:hypothetical protein
MNENTVTEIINFVIENGRVLPDESTESGFNLESLRVEVEFECSERGLDNCEEMADEAVERYTA